MSRLWFGGVAVLGAAGCTRAQEKASPPQAQAQQTHPLQGAADWRERMQKNHSADSSIEHQVRRLTKDLDLTPEQQAKVRLTHEAFTAQVHAISQEYHDSVNAILTPQQLELMKAMVGRLDSGTENRRAP
jgi:prephenate dehydrogenase